MVARDRSRVDITINNAAARSSGSITMINQHTPPSTLCNRLNDPYCGSLADHLSLVSMNRFLFERADWAVTMRRAASTVKVEIQGRRLSSKIASITTMISWGTAIERQVRLYAENGQGSCGPYDLT